MLALRSRIGRALVAFGGVYLAAVAGAALGYRKLLYPAPADDALVLPANAELWTLRAEDGVEVHAVHVPASHPSASPRASIVFFHGNGETVGHDLGIADALADRGLDVVLAEYRGYGVSKGAAAPDEEGLYRDADAVLVELARRGVPPAQIVLYGASLGTGVASEMARRHRGAGLVLFTPYTSIPDVAARWVPGLPMRWLIRDRFATLEKVKEIDVPVLIVHGTADHVVPYDMGVTLDHAFARAHLVTVEGGGHNDLYQRDPSLFDAVALAARDATRP